MYLTGYHGTNESNAKNIIESGSYSISCGSEEWLGNGVYFYFQFSDAFEWRDSEVILHSVICVDDEDYIDLESSDGKKVYNDAVRCICDLVGVDPSKNAMANQCAVANIIWDTNPEIKVIASSFAKEKTVLKTLIDPRERRREFCVRNNDYIRHTYMIRKDDVV